MEHREDVKREPKSAEAPREQPRPKRFRIVKLEERIAPMAGGDTGEGVNSRQYTCR